MNQKQVAQLSCLLQHQEVVQHVLFQESTLAFTADCNKQFIATQLLSLWLRLW